MNYTLALDAHKELQQHGFSTKAAGWLESVYREALEAALEEQFGGVWNIAGELTENDIPEAADGDSLNEVFARVAEDIIYELKVS